MTMLAAVPQRTDPHVRFWLGEHVIADYAAGPAPAMKYQAGMTRRFASLRVTIEPATAAVRPSASDS
jgi:hypothetical protein